MERTASIIADVNGKGRSMVFFVLLAALGHGVYL